MGSSIDQPASFDREFDRVVHWATDNRSKIHEEIEAIFGGTDLILDTPHNTYEQVDDKTVIIRKGAIRALPGDFAVIPSSISGDIVLVRATAAVTEILNSLSHGTGRLISRSGCKPLADTFDFSRLRETILIPSCVQDASLRTEGPYAYRDLDACLALLAGYVEMVARFSVVGYMGHL